MTAREYELARELSALYQEADGDPGFKTVLNRVPIKDDATLPELIEADGRLRLRLRLPLVLDRYLKGVPDLADRGDSLDAAIDMALRALARTGRPDDGAVNELVERYPEFGTDIRDAAALNNALWSTGQVRRYYTAAPPKTLPCDFGPSLPDGIHRYELRELLGEGAFGQVYLTVDRQLSEAGHPALVSIKLLSRSQSPHTRQQLIDEATKARRISHPHVAQVLDLGISTEGEHFVVYEYVAGGDLARWARRRGAIDIRQAVQLVAKITRGVHAAHMAGVVHCDLKPNNILLTADGEPKVADFGVAVRADDRLGLPAGQEHAQMPVGNLAFMSPEQFRMAPGALTIPTDIYALGGILYWLLTLILPNGTTPEAIRLTHDPIEGRGKPPPLRPHCPREDHDLEAICQRAMAIEPEQRFSSAAEFAESLDRWLRRMPLTWTKPSVVRRVVLWTKRKPAVAAAAMLIVVLSLAGGAAIVHFSTVARQQRFENAITAVKLEQEEKYRAQWQESLSAFSARLKAARAKGLSHEVLPSIWLQEWLFGPTVLGEGPEKHELWETRLEVIGDLVERYRSEVGPGAVQTLLWETALGFWLVGEGRPDEAELLLEGNLVGWRRLLDPDDPWLGHVQAMKDCATVARAGNGEPFDRLDLVSLEPRLAAQERTLDTQEPGSPLHYLLLTHLQTLYGPDLLNQPDRLAQVTQTLERVTA